jgi:hypothetical protein
MPPHAVPATDPEALAHGGARGFRRGFDEAANQARRAVEAHQALISERLKNVSASIGHDLVVLGTQIPADNPSGSPTDRTVLPPDASAGCPSGRASAFTCGER